MKTSHLPWRRVVAGALAASALLIAAPSAHAEEDLTPRASQKRIGLDLDLSVAQNWTGLGLTPFAQIGLTDEVFLDLEVPLGYLHYDLGIFGGDLSQFNIGNPTIGAHYAKTVDKDLSFFVGGNIAIPTHIDPSSETAFWGIYSGMTRAFYDFTRFLPSMLGLRARVGLEYRINDWLLYRGELNPVLAIPVGEGSRDTALFLEQANELEYRSHSGFNAGLRLQEVFILTDTSDHAQLALEPYVGWDDPKFFARVGYLVALDEDLGFGFDHNKVSTLKLSGGFKY